MACTIDCNKCNYRYAVKQICLANKNYLSYNTTKFQKIIFICELERIFMQLRKFYNID